MPCQPPKQRAEDEELLQKFKTCVHELAKPETLKRLSDLPWKYTEEQVNDIDLNSFEMGVSRANRHAGTLCSKFELLHLVEDWKTLAEKIMQMYNEFIELNDFSDFSKIVSLAKNLKLMIDVLVIDIPKPKNFANSHGPTENKAKMAEALNQYARKGELIISEPDYEGSNFERIENLLVNMQSTVTSEFSEIPDISSIDTSKCFVSIVCPSSSGKTQLAFAMRRIKPIYFVLSEMKDSTEQKVYGNFAPHLHELGCCARKDMESIAIMMKTNVSEEMDLSPDLLRSLSGSVPLWTIGYLMELINCNEPYKPNETWMEYYARRSDFEFYPAWIDDIPEGYFSEYCLYFDDCYTENWTVFVRNLGRAIGIKTICASRNTFVTGNVINERRKPEDRSVWSIVAVKLNSPSLAVLNTNYELEESIKCIKAKALGKLTRRSEQEIMELERKNPICIFLDDFISNQLKYMHPGVAIMLADALRFNVKHIQSNNKITLGKMLDTISHQVNSNLCGRNCMQVAEWCFFAKAGLLLPEAYSKDQTVSILDENDVEEKERIVNDYSSFYGEEDTKKCEPFFNLRHNSRMHLYHLSNPHRPEELFFLTFAPEEGSLSRSLMTYNYENRLVTWNYKYTHFEANNILTMLACLDIIFGENLTIKYNDALKSKTFDFTPVKKGTTSKKISTNPHEMYSALMVIFSSMCSCVEENVLLRCDWDNELTEFKQESNSLRGQKGLIFLKSLVFNMIPNLNDYASIDNISVNIPATNEFNLKTDFFDKSLIPFLYSIDRSIPIFDTLSDPKEGFYVKPYKTTSDSEQLDGRFEFLYDGQIRYVDVICKHQKEEITTTELKTILSDNLDSNDTLMSLVFCKKLIVDPTLKAECYNYCQTNRINAYRVNSIKWSKYQIDPLFEEKIPVFANPKSICIVIESEEFQKHQQQQQQYYYY